MIASDAAPIVDVVHPTGNQNVRQVIQALDETGLLGTFHTAFGFAEGARLDFLPASLQAECARRTYRLPPEKVRARPMRELWRLAAHRLHLNLLTRHETGWASIDRVYQDLDETVASRLRRPPVRAGVYGYEDGCLESFRVAQERGLRCLYDLPIAYFETVRRLMEEERARLPEWEPTLIGTRDSSAKLERKAREMALADLVVCPSQFVLRSLPPGARASKRCVVAEFGSPTSNPSAAQRTQPNGKLRVLFAGSMTQRKGLADVFAAMKLLNRQDVELVVMGSPIAPMDFYRQQYADFTYMSTRPHREVLELMRSCDALVLPSLAEGRALVQQEALANGLALIITENTGGEDLIVEGETGFVVPIRDPAAIAEKIAWLADHRSILPDLRAAAIRKAEEYPWARYRELVAAAVRATLAGESREARP